MRLSIPSDKSFSQMNVNLITLEIENKSNTPLSAQNESVKWVLPQVWCRPLRK